jgi:hypothetical protein
MMTSKYRAIIRPHCFLEREDEITADSLQKQFPRRNKRSPGRCKFPVLTGNAP